MSVPRPLLQGRPNQASAGASVQRLNGQVYTPLDLATAVVGGLRWPEGPLPTLLDAACGDGVFLEAAVRRLSSLGRPEDVVHVHGWDIDPEAVRAARERLDRVCRSLGIEERPVVEHRDAIEAGQLTVGAFVGNPPYLEAKRMPASMKRRIKARFPVSAWRGFDLYGAFVELGARSLATGGELALIIPNRVLVTTSTGRLRALLLETGRLAVTDLSRTRVFADAAVYPIVLRLDVGEEHAYVVESLERDAAFTLGLPAIERLGGRLPLPDPAMLPLLRRLLEDPEAFPPLGEALDVRWTVSFHRAGLRDAYVFEKKPDSPFARPFLGGARFAGNRELAPFGITWKGTWIDHDEERARADRNGLPPLSMFEQPKVVIPQNVRRPRAALDTRGVVLKDTFLAVIPKEGVDPAWLAWLVLVVNSGLFHHLYEAFYGGTRKGGAYLHLLGSYLAPFPLPHPPQGAVELHAARVEDPLDPELESRAEALVRRAYGVTASEGSVLDALELPEA